MSMHLYQFLLDVAAENFHFNRHVRHDATQYSTY